jgi:hypothetical protein
VPKNVGENTLFSAELEVPVTEVRPDLTAMPESAAQKKYNDARDEAAGSSPKCSVWNIDVHPLRT